jgi:hypothetical protein
MEKMGRSSIKELFLLLIIKFQSFYLAGGSISGYSEPNADYVILFSGRDEQTAAHEFLHSMLIPHTFTNKEAAPTALFTYRYRKTDNLMDYSHHFGQDNKKMFIILLAMETGKRFN